MLQIEGLIVNFRGKTMDIKITAIPRDHLTARVGDVVTPSVFVSYVRRSKKMTWAEIKVPVLQQDGGSMALVSLTDFAREFDTTLVTEASIREALTSSLRKSRLSHDSSATPSNLKKLCDQQKSDPAMQPARFVYRVCRPDQLPMIKTGGDLKPKEDKGDYSGWSLSGFFYMMWLHIRNGSREKSSFISATSDFESAMHWSYCGLLPVIKIDLNKLGESVWFDILFNDAQWLGGRDKNNIAVFYAAASREYIIVGAISGGAYELIRPKLDTHRRYVSLSAGKSAEHFPADLNALPDLLTYEVRSACVVKKQGSLSRIKCHDPMGCRSRRPTLARPPPQCK